MENKSEQREDNAVIQEGEVVNVEPKKDNSHTIIWCVIVVMLAMNVGIYWHWAQQRTFNQEMELALTTLPEPVVDTAFFDQALSTLEKQFQVSVSALKGEQDSLVEELDALRTSQKLTGADVEYYWIIAEVKYLLNVANQRALLTHDAIGAQEAIDLADSRIEGLSDHRLHPLRTLLAEEKLALSAVNNVDVEGLVLQLQSALTVIDSLQVVLAPAVESESRGSISLSDNNDWQGAFGQAWQQVKSLVVIRHQQDGAAAVLVPEQRYFLYQNLRLKLESARLALLSGEQSTYDASLSSASDWLQQYFVGDGRDAMLTLIAELAEQNIEVVLPDISASLMWLRGFEQ